MIQNVMTPLTGALIGALVVYLGGWFLNFWTGNFSLLLFILTSVTFLYWLAERFHFRPARLAAAQALEVQDKQRRAELASRGIEKVDGDVAAAQQQLLTQPWWVEWTAGLFPVILAVFFLRSFLFEPFKIPSGSMVPTLTVGDLILVNKFHYGIRLPVINKKIVDNKPVARGDVVVFRYPVDPRQDYIKRVVGLPGDEVSYLNQKLSINGQPVPLTAKGEHYDDDSMSYSPWFSEKLGAVDHEIRVQPNRVGSYGGQRFPNAQNCRYVPEGLVCKVPAGHYFMMGDNRDNSLDSRFWGFVPDENLVGRAFFVWMNFGNLSRIGSFN
jgi:signal peptidase I